MEGVFLHPWHSSLRFRKTGISHQHAQYRLSRRLPVCYSIFCFLASGNGALLSHIQHCYMKHLCICIRICGEGLTAFSHRLIKIVDTPLLSGLISLDENTTRYVYTCLFPCRLLAHDPFYQGDKSVQDIDCKRLTRIHTAHHIIPICIGTSWKPSSIHSRLHWSGSPSQNVN